MTPLKESYNSYEFTHEEREVLHQYLSSDVMRAYLSSTYAQIRDEVIASYGSPLVPDAPDGNLTLAFLSGAEDYLTQILRIGEDDELS